MTAPACADLTLEESELLFFSRDWTARAQGVALCGVCPVRQACLDQARAFEGRLSSAYRSGTWGGLSAEQRAKTLR